MTIDTFNFDGDGASVDEKSASQQPNGDVIYKLKFNNGFTLIYTKTKTGFKNMDFSHILVKDSKGFYQADLAHVKNDFYDYFPD
ncbi:hypothetical protein SH83_08765 [Lactiplantibacillus plantarum]|uniref:hypothetical protein n=1 Tax=Lactiplantibacillus plantarum TaxID=1590 RepID=UPI0005BEEE3B|nr:hypothetical protein [Lactiplantibacillus plantarum]AJO74431.1 hypothetical protein SH83_08765 [Lactiplantibacillus plantarum]